MNGIKILKDVWEVVHLYFKFLHLGYYYSSLSKRINFSRIAHDVIIETDSGERFHLKGEIIQPILNDIYHKPKFSNIVEYLALLNSVRGITMAVYEGLNKDNNFCELFKQVFPSSNQEEEYTNFYEVLRFIRNVLSHNIRDEMILQEDDFRGQKKEWQKEKGSKPVKFHYDYSSPNSPIHISGYTTKVSICIEWDKIIPGKTRYTDVVSEFQNLMFAEFCYNALIFLYKSWSVL